VPEAALGPRIEDRDGIRWVTLNRPATLNALTREDLRALRSAVEPLPQDVRAIALSGAGPRAFSSGVHTGVFADLTVEGARDFITELGDVTATIRRAPVPTVCVIRGYCLGGAMEIAMACDLRVVATDAVFGMPEIAVGIPSVLDAALLEQYVGLSRSREILLTGDLYPVGELAASGFANRLVAPEDLQAAAEHLLHRLASHSGPAMRAQKRLFRTWQEVGLDAGIAASIGEFAETFAHPETARRVSAYRPG
jgi:enoyl-CoA hydratase